jgi:glycerophosphoryl diester phosphodiesterase
VRHSAVATFSKQRDGSSTLRIEMVEVDVRRTRDGELVIHHDESVRAVTKQKLCQRPSRRSSRMTLS